METQREDNWVFNGCWGTTVQGAEGSVSLDLVKHELTLTHTFQCPGR